MSNPQALAEYRDDPGDAHAIARLRTSAYQKAIVMKYIDNLLDWGDNLFEQDTRESLNEATMLYVLGYSLLGARPEARPSKKFVEVGTYADVSQQGDSRVFLTEITPSNQPISTSNRRLRYNPHSAIATTFCVPENEHFLKYWDRVEDRLYKIRHSLNLEGIFRQLALFAPEIDPMALAQAAAGGRGISAMLADQSTRFPYFRFAFLLAAAKEMAGTAIDLGAALLAALQSRDAEQLAVLQTTQEQIIFKPMLGIKESELDEAKAEAEGKCDFRLTKQMFNQDYQGHYCRQIKTIGISIQFKRINYDEVQFSPYDPVHATLTQIKHQLLLKPDVAGMEFLMNPTENQPDESVVRTNWRTAQQIAISKASPQQSDRNEPDLGIFNLDFVFDNAYFPFENTGAVSSWELELSKETNPSVHDQIEDIVIHLRYTARSDGGLKAALRT